jgi:hypothetical protein
LKETGIILGCLGKYTAKTKTLFENNKTDTKKVSTNRIAPKYTKTIILLIVAVLNAEKNYRNKMEFCVNNFSSGWKKPNILVKMKLAESVITAH